MSAYDRLPDAVTEIFGDEATAEHAYDLLTVDVPAGSWIAALETARSELGCTFFDWLSAVDEPGTGFRVCAHVVSLAHGADGVVRRLLLRTTVPHEAAVLPTAVGVFAGADWHERETHEMFGISFTGHPHLVPLLLPEGFEGYPLRKDFVLAARVAKAWPGAKEPGEGEHGGPKRRQMLPPGVPDPNDWGPLKGQLPPAPARPARTPRAAGAAGADRPARTPRAAGAAGAARAAGGAAAADRPVRRARTAAEGSATQPPAPAPDSASASDSVSAAPAAPAAPSAPDASAAPAAPAGPRRNRSVSEGSASQAAGEAASAPAPPPGGPAGDQPAGARTRSSDAPWHHARPAFDGPEEAAAPEPPAASPAEEPHEPTKPSTPNSPNEAKEPGEPAETAERPGPESADGPGQDGPTDNAGGDPA